jgi:hypothetical protein
MLFSDPEEMQNWWIEGRTEKNEQAVKAADRVEEAS